VLSTVCDISGSYRLAWDRLRRWDEPFLVARGAARLDHPVLAGAGHFLREGAGELLAAEIVSFNANHPRQSRP